MEGVAGAGNGTYGVTLALGGQAEINSATTITGATGNATLDAGTTALAWLTDFATDGDRVTNACNGCNITRKD
jgi:hypothetical protein